MNQLFANQLFHGEHSRVQRLLHVNRETMRWPDGFEAQIQAARMDGHGQYFCPQSFGLRDPVINAPVLLALNAVSGDSINLVGDEMNQIETIRNIQSFDPEWFAEAFDLTIARCIATGAINLNLG